MILRLSPRGRGGAVALCALVGLSACSSSSHPATSSSTVAQSAVTSTLAPPSSTARATLPPSTTASRTSAPTVTSTPSTSRPKSTSRSKSRTPTTSAPTTAPPATTSPTTPTYHAPKGAPVIVLDPGHSPTIHATYHGLNVSDYENDPEMADVYAVALLVRTKLQAAGYRVVMTKTSLYDRVSLARRAFIANDAHAALALSIHDQAGSNGGVGFRNGNNIVYDQTVGKYRATASGKRVYFTNSAVAALSHKYGAVFQQQRSRIEGAHVRLQSDVGYNLGSRGLAPGNMWMVQLLAHMPWIYNEAGGNSAGRSGLNAADKGAYADALVAGVEKCVPLRR